MTRTWSKSKHLKTMFTFERKIKGVVQMESKYKNQRHQLHLTKVLMIMDIFFITVLVQTIFMPHPREGLRALTYEQAISNGL